MTEIVARGVGPTPKHRCANCGAQYHSSKAKDGCCGLLGAEPPEREL